MRRWRLAHPERWKTISDAAVKKWRLAHPRKVRDAAKRWREKNKDRSTATKNARRQKNPMLWAKRAKLYQIKSKYGMPAADYEQLLKEQHGACAICKSPLIRSCIDHDHATRKVRGLLCRKCNTGIGQLNDDSALLQSAIAYLEKHARPKQVG
jgi:hypothetical protein